MPRGGARKGAGRPAGVHAVKLRTVTVRLSDADKARLDVFAGEGCPFTQSEVMRVGIEEMERRILERFG